MCDTFVALGNSTKDGSVLFAKNSDRDPNEAQEIIVIPAATHQPNTKVKCTYIEIPQVEKTYRVLLCKPFWIWGGEMGSNEFGVTIGNEALFTREPYDKKPGLIGMDFLRLALERSKTAESALMTIVDLLAAYGQSGNCGYAHSFYYHNSYLICDANEAWVLETAGRQWAAEKVKDIRSISNAITIGKTWDRASENLVTHAVEKGWCKKSEEFDFGQCYSDPLYTYFANARGRQACTGRFLSEKKGILEPADMMSMLRFHNEKNAKSYSPGKGITGADVCMHAGFGPIRTSQTAGSLVSTIKQNGSIHWLTGTAAPCTSIFKPVWIDSGIPDSVKRPEKMYDERVLFWRHEVLRREIIKDYSSRIQPLIRDRRTFEDKFLIQVKAFEKESIEKRAEFSNGCFEIADQAERNWLKEVCKIPVRNKNHFYYSFAWKRLNQQAGLPV